MSRGEHSELIVQDYILPLFAAINPETDPRFLGTGFFVGQAGHIVTCRHVAEGVQEAELLTAYQATKNRILAPRVVHTSDQYDLALLLTDPPETPNALDVIGEPFVSLGSDVMAFGYPHEPTGRPEDLAFTQRVLKGHITGLARHPYTNAFELSFPSLSGMSGAPLINMYKLEGEKEERPGIAGVLFANHEARVLHHSVVTSTEETPGRCERFEERIERIVELGLAYKASVLVDMFREIKSPGEAIEFMYYEDPNQRRSIRSDAGSA